MKEGINFIEKFGHSGIGDITFIGVSKLPKVRQKILFVTALTKSLYMNS